MPQFKVKKNGNNADGQVIFTAAAGSNARILKAQSSLTYTAGNTTRTIFTTAADISADAAGAFTIPDQAYSPGIRVPAVGPFQGGTYTMGTGIKVNNLATATSWTVSGRLQNARTDDGRFDDPVCDWEASGSGEEEDEIPAPPRYAEAAV